jgi:hypothetical protein
VKASADLRSNVIKLPKVGTFGWTKYAHRAGKAPQEGVGNAEGNVRWTKNNNRQPGALGAAQRLFGNSPRSARRRQGGAARQAGGPTKGTESAFVKEWIERIEEGKDYWKDVFDQMRESAKFAAGKQWPAQSANDDRYRANITLRHINQRVASDLREEPARARAAQAEAVFQTWDGTPEMLRAAKNTLMARATRRATRRRCHRAGRAAHDGPSRRRRLVVQEAQDATQKKQLYRAHGQDAGDRRRNIRSTSRCRSSRRRRSSSCAACSRARSAT